MKKTLTTLVLLSLSLFAERYSVFSIMNSSGSPVSRAFGGTGSAVLQGPLSVSLNPALLGAWQKMYKKKVAVSAVAGKISEEGMIAGGAVSYELSPDNLIAAEFLYKKSDPYGLLDANEDKDLLRATLAISGPLVKEQEQELYLGINLAYVHHDDDLAYGVLPVTTTSVLAGDALTFLDSTTSYYAPDTLGSRMEQFLTMDVGFFQLDMGKSMTFSLVAENVLGYRWVKGTPAVLSDTVSTTNGDTTETVVTSYYDKQSYGTKWIDGNFKSMLIGGLSRIPIQGGDIVINIPLDFRFWGFLSKEIRKSTKLKERVEFYTGLELFKGNTFSGRLGYAWRNAEYHTNGAGIPLFNPEHLFSGGVTVKVKDVLIEGFWAKDEVGGGLTFGF